MNSAPTRQKNTQIQPMSESTIISQPHTLPLAHTLPLLLSCVEQHCETGPQQQPVRSSCEE